MLEAIYLALIAAAFVITTIIFLKIYLRVSAEIRSPVKVDVGADNEALSRLREILSRRRESDLKELLDGLREIKSEIEELIGDEERGSIESEGSGDSGGTERD